MKKVLFLLTFLSFSFFAHPVFASQVVINDVDTGIYGDGYAICEGEGLIDSVNKWPSGDIVVAGSKVVITKYDLSSLPQNALVTSSTLSIYPTYFDPFPGDTIRFFVERVNKDVDLNYFSGSHYSQNGTWSHGCWNIQPLFRYDDVSNTHLGFFNAPVVNTYNNITLDATEFQKVVDNNYGIMIQSQPGIFFFNSAQGDNPPYLTLDYIIDAKPVIASLSASTISVGDTYSVNSSFTDSDSTSWTARVDYGDGDGEQPLTLSGQNFSLNHQYTSAGAYTVTVTIQDNQGAVGTVTTIVTVNDNQPPQINTIANQTLNEGDVLDVSGSFTDSDSASWSATVDYGDGAGEQSLSLSGKNFTLAHQYKDNGSYTVTVKVMDNQGAIGTKTFTVTVNNLAPFVAVVSVNPSPAHINTSVTASTNFSDLGVFDTHTATIDWGDGSTPSVGTISESNGAGTASGSHTYTNFGTFTVTIAVKDNSNATGSNTGNITVVKQLTELDSASLYISKGLLTSNHFNLKAEVYKDTTLVTTGELNDFNPPTSGATVLATIPFNSFTPVDFPTGSALKIKVSACSATGLLTGTAKLHYNASNVDSRFGATIGNTSTTYHLLANSILGTSAGNSAQTVTAKSKCTTFTSFGTWTVTP